MLDFESTYRSYRKHAVVLKNTSKGEETDGEKCEARCSIDCGHQVSVQKATITSLYRSLSGGLSPNCSQQVNSTIGILYFLATWLTVAATKVATTPTLTLRTLEMGKKTRGLV